MTEKGPRNSENARSIPIIVALIGAAATLIAAFIGNKGGFSFLPGTPVKVVTMPPGTPVKVVTTPPEPQVTVTVTSGVTNQPAGIYHEGPLTLSNISQADLDAPPNDPQWGVINLTPGDSYSIESAPGEIDVENGAQAVQLKSAGNGTCASATGYSIDRLGVETPPLKIGQYICVHTAGGRFSLLKIVGLSADESEFEFYVKTFDGPND
jgi:lipoprotein-anchoring transpeptidase ErfK/SrfK